MNSIKITTIFIVLSIICINGYSQNKITKYLTYGEYSIGYKVIHTYDYSRSFFPKYDYYGKRTKYPIGRPIQISIWYPSPKGKELNNLQYQDYIGFTSSEINFDKNTIKDRKLL